MVKPVQKAEISSFVKGLITEANPLNFPSDASREDVNFILKNDGSRERRLGVDFEHFYTLRSTGYSFAQLQTIAISSFTWLNAGNDPFKEFVVIQFGNRIDVYDIAKVSVSSDGFIGSVTLTVPVGSTTFSYASIDGVLVIAAGTSVIHIVEYANNILTYSTQRLLVRDLWGLPGLTGNDLTTRPTVLSNSHLYNLHNQGWGIPRKNAAGNLVDPIGGFSSRNASTDYPSNSEVVYTGLQFQPIVGSNPPFERIFPNLYDEVLGLNVAAARGYFIIDALNRGTSRTTEFNNNKSRYPQLSGSLSSLPTDRTEGGLSVVADYAGRVFYAGFSGVNTDGDENSPSLSSCLLFSQLVTNLDSLHRCYQQGDPTSREGSDIVDTDGGFLRISGVQKIYGLVPRLTSLFVLADNGIWEIGGGGSYGFSATNYEVSKISSFGCNNTQSIVTVNDQIFYWGEEGIFTISRNQYGEWAVSSITESTIQKRFDEISIESRKSAIGIYDQYSKRIRWMFDQDQDIANTNIVAEVILNLQLRAFSLTAFSRLPQNTPEIVGYIPSASSVEEGDSVDVVVNSVFVEAAGEQVVVSEQATVSKRHVIKYITLFGSVGPNVGYTFSQFSNTKFKDWEKADGVGADAKAYVLTGTITASDSSVYKQTPYLVVHMLRTEEELLDDDSATPSSCLIRSQWDWANSSTSGRWSNLFQAYRPRGPSAGFETVVTKNKLRGRGRALSIYFETEPKKDCKLLGWNLSLTGNSLA